MCTCFLGRGGRGGDHVLADIVSTLLEAGADPGPVASGGWTALEAACAAGHQRSVHALLGTDIDADQADDAGRTLLHDAAEDGQWEIVRCERVGVRQVFLVPRVLLSPLLLRYCCVFLSLDRFGTISIHT